MHVPWNFVVHVVLILKSNCVTASLRLGDGLRLCRVLYSRPTGAVVRAQAPERCRHYLWYGTVG